VVDTSSQLASATETVQDSVEAAVDDRIVELWADIDLEATGSIQAGTARLATETVTLSIAIIKTSLTLELGGTNIGHGEVATDLVSTDRWVTDPLGRNLTTQLAICAGPRVVAALARAVESARTLSQTLVLITRVATAQLIVLLLAGGVTLADIAPLVRVTPEGVRRLGHEGQETLERGALFGLIRANNTHRVTENIDPIGVPRRAVTHFIAAIDVHSVVAFHFPEAGSDSLTTGLLVEGRPTSTLVLTNEDVETLPIVNARRQ
jgi:hypothetical protein